MQATHPYEGEDEDELSFDKGAVILVVPYDDPEDEVRVIGKDVVDITKYCICSELCM